MDSLLNILRQEKDHSIPGRIYHKLQIEMTYNSNHMEGSMLTHDQTRYIFETNTIGIDDRAIKVDDIVETANHFRCIDMVIEEAENKLSEAFIKNLHRVLKNGTSDSRLDWFAVGDYKKLADEVGGNETSLPDNVSGDMKVLIDKYNSLNNKSLDDILDFHVRFERIHPFQDGNGRIGRLILLKECLANDIVPFIISDDLKLFYYRGIKEWPREKGYLRDTCLTAQDRFGVYLKYFGIDTE